MLQFIAETNERYSIAELAQMVIEGGCKWIQLRVPDLTDSEIKELAAEIVPLCKETSTILTIENHVELAKELGLHGVHLKNYNRTAASVREEFGPEAIIGVEVEMASSAMALVSADVDYVTFAPSLSLERLSENIEILRESSFMLPVVAEGRFKPADIALVMETGVNGIAEAYPISTASDPVVETEHVILALKEAVENR